MPVHAIDAFEDNEHTLELSALLREQGIELGPVVVGERQALRPRGGNALHDAVNEGVVGSDPRSEQVADSADVRGVTADEDDRISDTIAAGKRFFQLLMNG